MGLDLCCVVKLWLVVSFLFMQGSGIRRLSAERESVVAKSIHILPPHLLAQRHLVHKTGRRDPNRKSALSIL
jgi:hypothetical protein